QGLAVRILQNIETFGESLHQPIFDAVVNHFDEMSGAIGTGMDVAQFSAWIAAVPSGRARRITEPGSKRLEQWIKARDDFLGAANHHAIAALESPDAAAGPDIDIVYGALLQFFGAPNIVFPESVAAIDNNVTRCKQFGQLGDRIFGNLAGRQHDPNRARCLQLLDKLVDARGANRAVLAQGRNRIGVMVIDDGLMAILNQPACDIAAHASETDHADLHVKSPITLVVRFQHLHPIASSTFANVGIKGPLANDTFLVEFGFGIRFADSR